MQRAGAAGRCRLVSLYLEPFVGDLGDSVIGPPDLGRQVEDQILRGFLICRSGLLGQAVVTNSPTLSDVGQQRLLSVPVTVAGDGCALRVFSPPSGSRLRAGAALGGMGRTAHTWSAKAGALDERTPAPTSRGHAAAHAAAGGRAEHPQGKTTSCHTLCF